MHDEPVPAPNISLVVGRSCEGCTLCCKLLNVSSLNKPRHVWCRHCEINKGCGIYPDRPSECAQFYCLYRLSPELSEDWRPSVCNMVVSYEQHINRVNISTNGPPEKTWRREPYYSHIRAMASHILQRRGHLLVWEEKEAIAILPDREVRLGQLETRIISVRGRDTPLGPQYDIVVLDPDDPEANAKV